MTEIGEPDNAADKTALYYLEGLFGAGNAVCAPNGSYTLYVDQIITAVWLRVE